LERDGRKIPLWRDRYSLLNSYQENPKGVLERDGRKIPSRGDYPLTQTARINTDYFNLLRTFLATNGTNKHESRCTYSRFILTFNQSVSANLC
jgi:hypothetical protein